MKNFTIITILGLFALAGCNDDDKSCDKKRNDDDPPPPVYDYVDSEPNNKRENAQYVTKLHQFKPKTIGGRFQRKEDLDYFRWFLDPPAGVDVIHFNVSLESESPTPSLTLWQSVVDSWTGDLIFYRFLGTYVGEDGNVSVTNIPLEYLESEEFLIYDVIVEVDDAWAKMPGDLYTLTFNSTP